MSDIEPFFPYLLRGLLLTMLLTVLAVALSIVVSFVAGLGRLSERRPLRWASSTFIEVFRGTSVIVQLFWLFYALPLIGVRLTPMEAAVWALGLNQGAYGAEIVRGAIVAVARGQREAGIALNMTALQRMRHVILPQAIPRMLPPFGNVAIDTLKATSLVSLVTVADLTFRAQIVRSSTGATTAIFLTILVVYFLLAYALSVGTRWLERRVSPDMPERRPLFAGLRPRGVAG